MLNLLSSRIGSTLLIIGGVNYYARMDAGNSSIRGNPRRGCGTSHDAVTKRGRKRYGGE